MHDLTRAFAILGATGAGVTLVTLLLIGAIVPQAGAEATPSAAPSFDLAVPPNEIGGSLTVTGDRSGTLQIERLEGALRYTSEDDGMMTVQRGQFRMIGDDGQIVFSVDPDEGIAQIDFDGLSFFLNPGDCDVALGERNDVSGVFAVQLVCDDLADIRGGGVVTIEGILAVPSDVLGQRGELPLNEGRVKVGEERIEPNRLIMVGGGQLVETGRVGLNVYGVDPEFILALEYDPDTAEMFLGFMLAGAEPVRLEEPCPVTAEELGELSELTTVMRLTIDCDDAVLEDGTPVTLDGTLVVDSDVKLGTLNR